MNFVTESDSGGCSFNDNNFVIETSEANVETKVENVDTNNVSSTLDISETNFSQQSDRRGEGDDMDYNKLTEGGLDENTFYIPTSNGEPLLIEGNILTYGESSVDEHVPLTGVVKEGPTNAILNKEDNHINEGMEGDMMAGGVSLIGDAIQSINEVPVLVSLMKYQTEESCQTNEETLLNEHRKYVEETSSLSEEDSQSSMDIESSKVEISFTNGASKTSDMQLAQRDKEIHEDGPVGKYANEGCNEVHLVENSDQCNQRKAGEGLTEEVEDSEFPMEKITSEHRQVENTSDPSLPSPPTVLDNIANMVSEEVNKTINELGNCITIETGCSVNTNSGLEHNVCTNKYERIHVEENYGVDILANMISADQDVIRDRSKIHYTDINKNANEEYFKMGKSKQCFDSDVGNSFHVQVGQVNDVTLDETDKNIDDKCDKNEEGTPNFISNSSFDNESEVIIPELVEELQSEEIDLFKEILGKDEREGTSNEIGDNDIDMESVNNTFSHFLCRSEILITFPQFSCSKGQLVYVIVNDDHFHSAVTTLRSETSVHVPFKELQPIFVVSTYLVDAQKQWSYLLSDSISTKQWRYVTDAHKEPAQVSFLVVEDPNCVHRWETTTYELMDLQPQLQQESDWVLIDCSEKEIELFHEHRNEMSQSVNVSSLNNSCATQ